MGEYKLLFKRSTHKELRTLPKQAIQRILKIIEALSKNPRPPGCEKLSGNSNAKYRVRQGNYRIIYLIQDDKKIVTIYKIGHRRDIYRSLR